MVSESSEPAQKLPEPVKSKRPPESKKAEKPVLPEAPSQNPKFKDFKQLQREMREKEKELKRKLKEQKRAEKKREEEISRGREESKKIPEESESEDEDDEDLPDTYIEEVVTERQFVDVDGTVKTEVTTVEVTQLQGIHLLQGATITYTVGDAYKVPESVCL